MMWFGHKLTAGGSAPRLTVSLLCLALLAACAQNPPRNGVPVAYMDEATPVGFKNVRVWGDHNDAEKVKALMLRRADRLKDRYGEAAEAGQTPRLKFLALSGGGQYGAFSAGILTAWSETGQRPMFDGVTGISTGAIIAPFAFLGPDYDPVLEEVYTTLSTEDVAESTVFSGLLAGSALADTAPLAEKIAHYITPEVLDKIGDEYRKGRVLYVGTTNIDVGRSVMWDMGQIAASKQPGSLKLFRDIILASAAIPIAFPPVFFAVEANGRIYEEMHVDGGVTSQVNILSPQIPYYLMDELIGFHINRELYVIVNGPIIPPPAVVEPRFYEIGSASLNTLWYAQTVGDLYKIHAIAERDSVGVRYTWIPKSFEAEPLEQFDPAFMSALFAEGQKLLKNDTLWHEFPPDYTAETTPLEEIETPKE